MATITPTLRNQKWGPERWHRFDFAAHPIRDVGGNPCIIWRHGGAGWGGNLSDCWLLTEPYNPFFEYVLNAARDVHFDIVSIETGQQIHLDSANKVPQVNASTTPTGLPRTKRLYMADSLLDYKHGIASIKRILAAGVNSTYFGNPDKVIVGGWSHGSSLAGLSAVTNPISISPGRDVWYQSGKQTQTYDSTTLGVAYLWGQIDIRRRSLPNGAGVYAARNYLDITAGSPSWGAAWYGTRANDAGAEWSSYVPSWWKEAFSLLAYIDQGRVENYVPMFVGYGDNVGAHTYPLSDVHDSVQRTDLVAALEAAKLPYQTGTTQAALSGFFTDVESSQLYNWMKGLASVSTRRVSKGAVR